MNGLITLTFSGFPEGYCYPGDPNDFATDLLDNVVVEFNTSTGNFYYNFGPDIPSVDNRVYPWFRTGIGDYSEGWYYWNGTAWIMAHPVPASGNERRLWVGSTADLETYDGGSAGAVTSTTGPFWTVDTNFAGKFPIGPGTVGTTAIAVTDTGGSHEATLSNDIIAHTHAFGNYAGGNDDARFLIGTSTTFPSQNSMEIHGDTGNPQEANITAGNLITAPAEVTAGADPVPTMPPYYGTYVIKRTARVYRTV